MTQENLLLREDGYPHLPQREVTDNGVVKAKLVANMIRYTSATKQQAKAIVDGCFDGDSAINISDLEGSTRYAMPHCETITRTLAEFSREVVNKHDGYLKNGEGFFTTLQDAEALRQENAQLRELLCLRSSSSTHMPYMDDGELQDNSAFPHIDYKRDSVAEIISKLQQRTLKELEGGAA